MKKIITSFIVLFSVISCHKHQEAKNSISKTKDTLVTINKDVVAEDSIYEKEIICDSVYLNKNYKIILRHFSSENSYEENDKNTVFTFSKKLNGKYKELFRDSIESHVGAYEFQDFNGDKIKDILIQNISDVRGNWSYYLYLIDLKNDRLTKIKNFNEIKNPHYLPQYNVIDNEVMSGRNWTSFYQIKKDTVFDFEYIIYDGEDDNGNVVDFEKEYDKTLSKVLKNKNYK